MSKKSVSPSGEQTFTFVFLYSIMAATVSLGETIGQKYLPQYMESNTLEKSTSKSVTSSFFARTPNIRRIVKICDVVDRFLRKTL